MRTSAELKDGFARIQELSRKYRATTDAAERRLLQQQIDRLDAEAAADGIAARQALLDHLDGDASVAMARARDAAAGSASRGLDSAELREFVTPGSTTTDLWVKPSQEQVLTSAAAFAKRDAHTYLTTDTGTIGSAYYFTPELYQNVVLGLLSASGVLEANPTVLVTDHLRDIQVPVLSSDAVASAGTEGSAATAAHTTGTSVTLGAHRFDGVFTVSVEMLMSSEYNLEQLLSTFAVRATANKVAAMLALGNGTTEPQGLFYAGAVTAGATTASATAATMDEMIAAGKAVPKGYRKNSRWVVSDVLHTALLALKNGEGDYLLRTIEGGGEQFMGRPLFTEPQADQSGMSATEVHCVTGDFSGFFVRLSNLFFRRSDSDPLNPTFHFAIWLDAKVADANALRSLVMSA